MLLLLCLRLSYWFCSLSCPFNLIINDLLDEMAVLTLNWCSRSFWCSSRRNILILIGRLFSFLLWTCERLLYLFVKHEIFHFRVPWCNSIWTIDMISLRRFVAYFYFFAEQLWITGNLLHSLKHVHVLFMHILGCCFRLFQNISLPPLIFSKLLHRTGLFFNLQGGRARFLKPLTSLPLAQEEVLLCTLSTLLRVNQLLVLFPLFWISCHLSIAEWHSA